MLIELFIGVGSHYEIAIVHSAIIIGCGKMAGGYDAEGHLRNDSHLAAIKSNKSLKLVGCVDIDIDKASLFALQNNCVAFSKVDEAVEMLRPCLVIICTPDDTHYLVALRVLSSAQLPKLIFIEKPACLKLGEYEQLVALARIKGVIIIVNHTRRFDHAMKDLKKRISGDFFGSLDRVIATYYGGWFHNGIHLIDTLSFLFDDEVEIAHVSGSLNKTETIDPTIECEGFFRNNGARITINGLLEESLYQIFEFDFWFQRGRLRVEDFGSRIIFEKKVQNEMGENVLLRTDLDHDRYIDSALSNAYNLIAHSLKINDYSKLHDVRLENVLPAMRALWHGERLLGKMT